MRRTLNILTILLILASAMRITVDRHICGGRVVEVRLELSDKRASCGMEEDGIMHPDYFAFGVNCCHNETATFSVDNYIVTDTLDIEKPFSPITDMLLSINLNSTTCPGKSEASASGIGPPGECYNQPDRQSMLCIFQI